MHSASGLRHGVDAAELDSVHIQSVLLCSPACTHSHAVVVGEDAVEIRMGSAQQRVGHTVGTLLSPVGMQLFHYRKVLTHRHYAVETAAALDGGRRRRESAQFYYPALSSECRSEIFAHRRPYFSVVGTDVGGVFVGTGAAVEYDDGDSCLVGTVDGGRDGHLSRCDDEQVNALFHEFVYLLRLQLHIVESRRDAQVHIIIIHGSYAQLLIQLFAPCVFRALRHADDISFLPVAGTRHSHCSGNEQYGKGEHEAQKA